MRVDHIFRVFSNTKLVTSCAALLQFEEARFRPDDPIEPSNWKGIYLGMLMGTALWGDLFYLTDTSIALDANAAQSEEIRTPFFLQRSNRLASTPGGEKIGEAPT